MTKNELPLIEDWIKYHGHLFSFENLFIIDRSTDQQVLNIYQKYENSGINVITTNANLNRLATEITSIMHRHKGRNSFLIKLDTDEFLAYRKSDDGGEFANHDITSILNSLPVTGQKYKASYTARSVPQTQSFTRPCTELTTFAAPSQTEEKSFFHCDSFISIDLGCHRGKTSNDEGFIPTTLTTIHFHSINLADCLRRARQVLVSHGYIDEGDDRDEELTKIRALLHRVRRVTPQGVEYHASSFHKVLFYLEQLSSDPGDEKLVDTRFNNFVNDTMGVKNSSQLMLVRDTLLKLDEDYSKEPYP